MNGNKRIFGFCNVVFHATRPEGSRVYFETRAERDEALAAVRDRAVRNGLSASAAQSGIYPVKTRAARVRLIADGYHVRLADGLDVGGGL